MSTNATVITGQLVLTGSVQQLPQSVTLSQGVMFSSQSPGATPDSVSIDTNPNGNGATDGTGTGFVITTDFINSPLIPVANLNAFWVCGTSGDILSWVAW